LDVGTNTLTAGSVKGFVDRFSILRDSVLLTGWCFAEATTVEWLEIRPPGGQVSASYRFRPEWIASPDVEAVHGPAARRCRFDGMIGLGAGAAAVCGGTLAAVLTGGAVAPVGPLGSFKTSAASDLSERFFHMLADLRTPRVLEVGSRARSGITRRDRMPAGADYTGCDIVDGENVDVVCDAHALSARLPHGRYDAVLAISVLEHLLMPWKFVIELNKVLAPGAIGMFATHQCWPIHDAPWDYWRFSDRAWQGLLNSATGFEIIDAAMGEPAYISAEHCHPATNFGREPQGFLASNVLFRKKAETSLTWNVELSELVGKVYPG
jgi:hypothetical protein